METNNIKYTNAALDQLDKFKSDQARNLEKLIIESKSFPGADFIEITASDIQEQARNFSYQKETLKSDIRYLLIYVYFIFGVGLMLFGFLYQDILNIWKNSPKQGLYILMGFTMTILSGLLLVYTMYREKRRLSAMKKYSDYIKITEKNYLDEIIKSIENKTKSAHNLK